jgi:hypothetical protein
MLKKIFFIATTTAAISLCSSGALASGADISKGAKTSNTQLYNVGKQVYKEKYACDGCSMANKSLDEESAKTILKGKEIATLSEREAKGLEVYLTKKFDL